MLLQLSFVPKRFKQKRKFLDICNPEFLKVKIVKTKFGSASS